MIEEFEVVALKGGTFSGDRFDKQLAEGETTGCLNVFIVNSEILSTFDDMLDLWMSDWSCLTHFSQTIPINMHFIKLGKSYH